MLWDQLGPWPLGSIVYRLWAIDQTYALPNSRTGQAGDRIQSENRQPAPQKMSSRNKVIAIIIESALMYTLISAAVLASIAANSFLLYLTTAGVSNTTLTSFKSHHTIGHYHRRHIFRPNFY